MEGNKATEGSPTMETNETIDEALCQILIDRFPDTSEKQHELWKVTYPAWDGTKIDGYTTSKECAEKCKNELKWAVADEPELATLPSKVEQFNTTKWQQAPYLSWIRDPPYPDPNGELITQFEIWKLKDDGAPFLIQQGLRWAMKMREPLGLEHRVGPLKDVVLPKKTAEELATAFFLQAEDTRLWTQYLFQREVLEWIKRHAGYSVSSGGAA